MDDVRAFSAKHSSSTLPEAHCEVLLLAVTLHGRRFETCTAQVLLAEGKAVSADASPAANSKVCGMPRCTDLGPFGPGVPAPNSDAQCAQCACLPPAWILRDSLWFYGACSLYIYIIYIVSDCLGKWGQRVAPDHVG